MGLLDSNKYQVRDNGLDGLIGLPQQYQTNQYQSPVMRGLLNYLDFGMRYDNSAPKGLGYFGELPTAPNPPYKNQFMTEYSVGVPLAGKEREVPSIVPTLVPQELDWLRNGGKMTDEIVRKAYEHAMSRYNSGLSPFAD